MTQMIAGIIIFLGVHSISIINEAWRDKMAERLGGWSWKGIYSIIALMGLILLIRGYGEARTDVVEVYYTPVWLQNISLIILIPVFPLLVGTYVPGRIKAAVEHPMLLATKLWAAAHLLANGTLADLVLFGSFLLWVFADLLSVSKRQPRQIPGAPPSRFNDWIAVIVGLALYLAFLFWLHEMLFGVSPM
ncbi:MAG: NnrU family protein [Desulfofustis sp.]|nr:NnrU family protein [Desulfofustis sp.]